MRILLISTFFPPQQAVASLRAWSYAREWSEAGESVTVLTTPKRHDQRGLERTAPRCEIVDVSFRAAPWREWLRRFSRAPMASIVPESEPGTAACHAGANEHANDEIGLAQRLARRLQQSTGIFSAVRMPDITDAWVRPAARWALQQQPWDLVLSSSGPYTTHLVAREIKRRCRARAWIAEFRDLWTDNHIYRGLFPFTWIEQMREQRCLHEADMIVTVSDGLADTLRAKTVRPVEVIYNGYDEAEVDAQPSTQSGAKSARSPGREEAIRLSPHPGVFVIAYTGTIYPPAQNPQPLLDALRLLRQHEPETYERIRLVVVGERMEEWTTLRDERGLQDAVELRGVVPREQALALQRSADALLVLDWNTPHAGILTAKAFEYLATAVPILIVGRRPDSSLGALVHRAGRGRHLGDNAAHIAERLRELVRNPCALNLTPDREFVATLSRQRQAARLLALARGLVNSVGEG